MHAYEAEGERENVLTTAYAKSYFIFGGRPANPDAPIARL